MIQKLLLASCLLWAENVAATSLSAPEPPSAETNRPFSTTAWLAGDLVVSPATLPAFTTAAGTPSAYQTILINGTGLTGDVTVTASAGFEIAWLENGPYGSSQVLTQLGGTVTNVPLYVRLAGNTLGSFTGTVTVANTGSASRTVAVSGTVTAAPTPNPVPVLTSISPSSGGHGPPIVMDLNGSGFVPGATVSMDLTRIISTTYVSSTHLRALVQLPSRATSVQARVIVKNPLPGGGDSAPQMFNILATAPIITSFSPSSGPVGTAVTIQGYNLYLFSGGATVSFNGTQAILIPPTPSGEQITAVVPAGATTGLITLANKNGAAVSATPFVVTASPPPFFENFEQGTKTSYTPASVALASGGWTFGEALIGTTAGADKFNGSKSARLRGGGFVEMDVDKPNGAGVVTVSAATYSTETGVSFLPEISTDGGVTYTSLLTGPAPVLTPNLTTYSFTANRGGNVRLRFSSSNLNASTNPRINIDDVGITNFTVTSSQRKQGLPQLVVYPNPAQNYLTVATGSSRPTQVTLHDLTGRVVLPQVTLPASQRLTLPASLPQGSYLLQVNSQGEQRMIRFLKQ
ncbi:IPT/TIG domain-containing protein [Hymenobacter weizhouensis]|uniref:IPT/TIG domain-containing protein n=1 Tax=Hymenobacter sp. YIM 151500-1 TaxID=2987689 RepID=UPI002226D411|nr:IPT/TIG domain-containing protein [Hymenobacter sp. YIM 151500-1]UYZ61539.1 T9SS type A sorting domain-containing protein [Hymenobacter sp. YIM 151500-1]